MKMLKLCLKKNGLGRLTVCYPAHLLAWLHKLNPVGQFERGKMLMARYIRLSSWSCNDRQVSSQYNHTTGAQDFRWARHCLHLATILRTVVCSSWYKLERNISNVSKVKVKKTEESVTTFHLGLPPPSVTWSRWTNFGVFCLLLLHLANNETYILVIFSMF